MPSPRKPLVAAPAGSQDTLSRIFGKYESPEQEIQTDRQIDGKIDRETDGQQAIDPSTDPSTHQERQIDTQEEGEGTLSTQPPMQTDRRIDRKTDRQKRHDEARRLGQGEMKTSGLKIATGFDDWMADLVYRNRKAKLTKQDILRRGLELVFLEVAENGGEWPAD